MKVWYILMLPLAISGCALARFSENPEGQPVYVLSNPSCVFICLSNTGTAREETTGFGGGAVTGGGQTLSQSATATAGMAR